MGRRNEWRKERHKAMTVEEARKYGLEILKGTESPGTDRDLILSFVTGKERNRLISHGDDILSDLEARKYRDLLSERKMGRPIAYITGTKEFMGLSFEVNEDVLIPRPDTEILVEEGLRLAGTYLKGRGIKLLDMCSGSGAIGISAAVFNEDILVWMRDISQKACDLSGRNAVRNGVDKRCSISQGDLFKGMEEDNKFDIILSNPPYIRREDIEGLIPSVRDYEPYGALDGGEDGLFFYREIISKSRGFLIEGGFLAFETGHDQADEVAEIMMENGYSEIKIVNDLSGIKRVVSGRKN